MIKKRSKFWTVALAMIPGLGHMFNGFMKLGLSFMSIFAGVWFLATWLNFGPLGLLAPVVWFYAFFDCLNRRFLDDEEFYAQEDHYLITEETLKRFHLETTDRTRQVVGIALVVVGVYAIWNNIFGYWMIEALPMAIRGLIRTLSWMIPQLIVAGLIIWAGVSLIRGRREAFAAEEAPAGEAGAQAQETARESGMGDAFASTDRCEANSENVENPMN